MALNLKAGDRIRVILEGIVQGGYFSDTAAKIQFDGHNCVNYFTHGFLTEQNTTIIPKPWVPKVGDKYRIIDSYQVHEIVGEFEQWFLCRGPSYDDPDTFPLRLYKKAFTFNRVKVED